MLSNIPKVTYPVRNRASMEHRFLMINEWFFYLPSCMLKQCTHESSSSIFIGRHNDNTNTWIINGYKMLCSRRGSTFIRYIDHLVFTATLHGIYHYYLNLTNEEHVQNIWNIVLSPIERRAELGFEPQLSNHSVILPHKNPFLLHILLVRTDKCILPEEAFQFWRVFNENTLWGLLDTVNLVQFCQISLSV